MGARATVELGLSRPLGGIVTERQWELYRLSVVDRMPESSYKAAVVEGIRNKLSVIDTLEASTAAAAFHARLNAN